MTPAWRQIGLQRAKKQSTFATILSCSVTPEAHERCSTLSFTLDACDWGLEVLKGCWCSYISPVSARAWPQLGATSVSTWTKSSQHWWQFCCVLWHPRHLTGAQPFRFHCMPMKEGCGSWNAVNAATSHLSAPESNVSLASDRPPGGQKAVNIHKDFVLFGYTWVTWQVLNLSIYITCLLLRLVGLEMV